MTEPTPLSVLTQIARSLATESHTLEQICQKYEFDLDFFKTEIEPNPYFRRVLEDYTKEWNSLGSSQKRLAFSSLTALEEALPTLAARMGDVRSDLSDAVAVGKLLRELAGIAAPTAQPTAGSGTPFTISINFGDNQIALKATSDVAREQQSIGASSEATLQEDRKRALAPSSVGKNSTGAIDLVANHQTISADSKGEGG